MRVSDHPLAPVRYGHTHIESCACFVCCVLLPLTLVRRCPRSVATRSSYRFISPIWPLSNPLGVVHAQPSPRVSRLHRRRRRSHRIELQRVTECRGLRALRRLICSRSGGSRNITHVSSWSRPCISVLGCCVKQPLGDTSLPSSVGRRTCIVTL